MCQRCSHRSLAHLSEPETGPGNTLGIDSCLGALGTLLGGTRCSASGSLVLHERSLTGKVHTHLHPTGFGISQGCKVCTGFAPCRSESTPSGKIDRTRCSLAEAWRFPRRKVGKPSFPDSRLLCQGCTVSRRLEAVSPRSSPQDKIGTLLLWFCWRTFLMNIHGTTAYWAVPVPCLVNTSCSSMHRYPPAQTPTDKIRTESSFQLHWQIFLSHKLHTLWHAQDYLICALGGKSGTRSHANLQEPCYTSQ